MSRFIFLHVDNVPAPFAEKIVFVPLYLLSSFVKDHLTLLTWINFWALCSVSRINLSFHQDHLVLITLALQYVLKSGSVSLPTLFFFLNCVDILSLLPLHKTLESVC